MASELLKFPYKGDGADTSEELTATNIDKSTVRVTFVADNALKQEVRNEISFSKVAEKHSEPKE